MIVTFYSYKGGVGRSMAMANVADVIARRGARVLMIDFDLEAPGLEQYFRIPQATARRHAGLIDLLTGYKQAMSTGSTAVSVDAIRDLDQFIFPVYEKLPGGGRLDLMPAGARADTAQLDRYANAVRTFDWQDFFFNWEGELFFEWMRDSLVPERYDLVLVDSRTGVTEMGGICAYQLGDVIVMMCAANRQNVRGTQDVAADFLSSRVLALRHDRPPQLVLVPARVEQRSAELLGPFIAEFSRQFDAYLPQALRDHGIGYGDLMVPYEPEYAFEERVLSDPAQTVMARPGIGAAFRRLANAIVRLAPSDSALARIPAPDAGVERVVEATPRFDPTTRFAGYDAYLFAGVEDRYYVQQIADALGRHGLRVFTDFVGAAPGPDWQQRTEQVIHLSRACLVVVGTRGSDGLRSALQSVLRLARSGRDVPVVPVVLDSAGEDALKLVPGLADLRPIALTNWPLDDSAIVQLADMVRGPQGASTTPSLTGATATGAVAPEPAARAPAAVSPTLAAPVSDGAGLGAGRQAPRDTVSTSAPITAGAPPATAAAATARASPATSAEVIPLRSGLRNDDAARIAEANPWRGTHSLREEDAADFFGRSGLLAQAEAASLGRVLWVVGPSGSGKSSLVEGSLIPALRRSGRFSSIDTIAVMPGCADRLETALGGRGEADSAARRVLFIDDFERAVLTDFPAEESRRLISLITRAAVSRDDVFFILAAREDALAQLLRGDLSAINVGQPQVGEVRLGTLAADDLRQMIERPAERAGLAFEPGLVDRIVKDAGSNAGVLPAVTAVLATLWRQRRDGFLTNAAYDAMGGLRGALAGMATRALARVPGGASNALSMLARLVTLAESGSNHSRRRALRAELLHDGTARAGLDAMLEHFVAARIVTACANTEGDACVEFVHDALALHWPELEELIAQDLAFLTWRQALNGYRADWLANHRDARALLSGSLRATAVDILGERRRDLNAAEIDYITQSARNDRLTRGVRVAVLAFWLVLIGGIVGWNYWKDQSRTQAEVAASRLAAQGDLAAYRGDFDGAILAYTEALRSYPDRQALLLKRAAAYAADKEDDRALADYLAVLKNDPKVEKAHVQVAELYARQDRLPEAEAAYTRALELAPRDVTALHGRGVVRARRGQRSAAIADFTAALAVDAQLTATYFERGRLYEQEGDRERAVRDFESALDAATDEKDRVAPGARLKALGATAQQQALPARTLTVVAQVIDARDRALVAEVMAAIGTSGTFRTDGVEFVPQGRTLGDIRFVAPDRAAAGDLRSAVELGLAQRGFRVRLELIMLDPKRFPDARPGRLEVWVPPLRQANLGADVRQMAK